MLMLMCYIFPLEIKSMNILIVHISDWELGNITHIIWSIGVDILKDSITIAQRLHLYGGYV